MLEKISIYPKGGPQPQAQAATNKSLANNYGYAVVFHDRYGNIQYSNQSAYFDRQWFLFHLYVIVDRFFNNSAALREIIEMWFDDLSDWEPSTPGETNPLENFDIRITDSPRKFNDERYVEEYDLSPEETTELSAARGIPWSPSTVVQISQFIWGDVPDTYEPLADLSGGRVDLLDLARDVLGG
jgi:hypothetical protein